MKSNLKILQIQDRLNVVWMNAHANHGMSPLKIATYQPKLNQVKAQSGWKAAQTDQNNQSKENC
jgi:hypothetical protein